MRHVGLLAGIRVERRRGMGSVCGTHKKRVKAYNRVRFCSLKDALLAAPRMRSSIGFNVFKVFSAKVLKVAENEMIYTTVTFAPLKDAQVGRARMGPVTGFYIFCGFTEIV